MARRLFTHAAPRALHPVTPSLHPTTPPFTPLHRATPHYAPLHPATPRDAPLHPVTPRSTPLHPVAQGLEGEASKRFYLQYAFPPFSVGEVGRNGAPGRREVGHGNLAERSLLPAVPSEADFPYTMRIESLITESCGSSSMASVCGGCLAMMAAGGT